MIGSISATLQKLSKSTAAPTKSNDKLNVVRSSFLKSRKKVPKRTTLLRPFTWTRSQMKETVTCSRWNPMKNPSTKSISRRQKRSKFCLARLLTNFWCSYKLTTIQPVNPTMESSDSIFSTMQTTKFLAWKLKMDLFMISHGVRMEKSSSFWVDLCQRSAICSARTMNSFSNLVRSIAIQFLGEILADSCVWRVLAIWTDKWIFGILRIRNKLGIVSQVQHLIANGLPTIEKF